MKEEKRGEIWSYQHIDISNLINLTGLGVDSISSCNDTNFSVPQNSNQYWKNRKTRNFIHVLLYICTALTALPQTMIYFVFVQHGQRIYFVLVWVYYYISYISWFTSFVKLLFHQLSFGACCSMLQNSLFQCNNLIWYYNIVWTQSTKEQTPWQLKAFIFSLQTFIVANFILPVTYVTSL